MPDFLLNLNDLEQVCGTYCLQFWQTVGIWLAGLATTAAVIVSLWLARRQRPRLRVSAGHRLIVTQGDPGNSQPCVALTVRNVGERAVSVAGFGWHKAPWSKSHGYQDIPAQITGETLPRRLSDGESVTFYIALDDPEITWAEDIVRHFLGRWPKLGVRLLRISAYTQTGETFYAPIEASLRTHLLSLKAVSQAANGP